MPLDEYRKKRDFKTTPEPSGRRKGSRDRLSYVIQKHAASHLHWDFRVELGGVLLSWAVPKGPSYDTADKRLAMHVEDHPVEYGGFEGTIPKGEYGGGTVMLWDRGWWEPFEGTPKDAEKQVADGVLKMVLHGERLQGRWVLVRTHGYGGGRDSWLLIKEHDGGERERAEFDATAEWMTSVATDRTMDEIADGDDVWHSGKPSSRGSTAANEIEVAVREARKRAKKPPGRAPSAKAGRSKTTKQAEDAESSTAENQPAGVDPSSVPGAKRAKLPLRQTVELATLVKDVPRGAEWLHEVKFDGYRMLAFAGDRTVRLVSRNEKDWTERFASVTRAVRDLLGDRTALLDGEVVVLKPDGTSSFQLLQNFAMQHVDAELHYYLFDLLYLDGWDLRGAAFVDRKRLLTELIGAEDSGLIRLSQHIEGNGEMFYGQACEHALEGVVSKVASSKYREGRQREWLKSKCLLSQEFVVIGYTDPGGARSGFGALVLAVRDDGALVPSGRVGTGFTEASLAEILAKLRPLERKTPPVDNASTGAAARGIHWVDPVLVAEVAFAEWTDVGQLRHPSFLGLRDDKSADEVVRERPAPPPSDPPDPAQSPRAASSSAKAEPTVFAGVKVTNPDRVLWPDVGVTKLEAMRYYESVAELVLPHMRERPLSLVRCPSGYTGECFYQKHITNFPSSVATVDIYEPDEKRSVPYARVTGLASIIGLVQMGVLEIHPWGCRADNTDRPDRLVFDLDPDKELPFTQVAGTALLLRSELSRFGLSSWLKSTGGKGLHVVVPIARTKSWDEVHEFSHAFVNSIVAIEPALFTATMSMAKRGGRIFIDYLRNTRGATSVAAYSTRARPGAPVSVPLEWSEIDGATRMPEFTVRNLGERVGASGFRDPWTDIGSRRQSVTKEALKRLGLV